MDQLPLHVPKHSWDGLGAGDDQKNKNENKFKQKGPNREWRSQPGPYSIPELASSKKRITTYFENEITYYSQLFTTSCLFFKLQQKKN